MPFSITLQRAKNDYPEYSFVQELTPSEQKAAFHVVDKDGQHLCLKIIAPNYDLDRLSREIRALQSLDHPNVAHLKEYTYSSKQGQQRHYMVEEYIEGTDLSQKLVLGQHWSTTKASHFFSALCDGLSALRKIKIVHRDLKPSNIRVRTDGTPVIIDFGVARHLDLPAITNTEQGARIGTPLYFAPEQWIGTKYDIDHRTDLFAVGVLLYQALVGQHPFQLSGISLRDAVCSSYDHQINPVFDGLPKEWKLVVNKLLEKDRGNRPYDASQVAAMLRRIGGN